MKKHYLRLLSSVIFFFLFVGFAKTLTASDKEKTFTVSKGDKLEVLISNGNVSIVTWEKDQAYIKAVNIDESDLNKLKIEQIKNKIVVDFKGKESDDFYIEVSIPVQFNLDLSSGGGNISAKGNILGKVELSTGGGNINFNDVGDKLSAYTGGGDIILGNLSGESEVSTGGGNIKMKEAKNKIKVSSGGGEISIGAVGSLSEISTGGGNIAIGKASGNVEISTGGGNIKLDGANGKVKTSTGGGNISLKNIIGSIEASTGSGNIDVDLDPQTGSKSDLNTGSGNITLYISNEIKTTIHATFPVGNSTDKKNLALHINSFDYTDQDANGNDGNATITLNGGGDSKIDLDVAKGEIFIKNK